MRRHEATRAGDFTRQKRAAAPLGAPLLALAFGLAAPVAHAEATAAAGIEWYGSGVVPFPQGTRSAVVANDDRMVGGQVAQQADGKPFVLDPLYQPLVVPLVAWVRGPDQRHRGT